VMEPSGAVSAGAGCATGCCAGGCCGCDVKLLSRFPSGLEAAGATLVPGALPPGEEGAEIGVAAVRPGDGPVPAGISGAVTEPVPAPCEPWLSAKALRSTSEP